MLDVYRGEMCISTPYKIRFTNCRYLNGRELYIIQFEITTLSGEEVKNDVVFSDEFIEDFYELFNEPRKPVANLHKKDFIWWSWMKITEKIDTRTLASGEIIRVNDIKWAKSVKQNLDPKICEALNNDGINYYPEKKLGFV